MAEPEIANPDIILRNFITREDILTLPSSRLRRHSTIIEVALSAASKDPGFFDAHLHQKRDGRPCKELGIIAARDWDSGKLLRRTAGMPRVLVWVHFVEKKSVGGHVDTPRPKRVQNSALPRSKRAVRGRQGDLFEDKIEVRRPKTPPPRDYLGRFQKGISRKRVSLVEEEEEDDVEEEEDDPEESSEEEAEVRKPPKKPSPKYWTDEDGVVHWKPTVTPKPKLKPKPTIASKKEEASAPKYMLDVKGYVRNSFKEKPLQHRSQPVLENSQTAQHDQGDTGKEPARKETTSHATAESSKSPVSRGSVRFRGDSIIPMDVDEDTFYSPQPEANPSKGRESSQSRSVAVPTVGGHGSGPAPGSRNHEAVRDLVSSRSPISQSASNKQTPSLEEDGDSLLLNNHSSAAKRHPSKRDRIVDLSSSSDDGLLLKEPRRPAKRTKLRRRPAPTPRGGTGYTNGDAFRTGENEDLSHPKTAESNDPAESKGEARIGGDRRRFVIDESDSEGETGLKEDAKEQRRQSDEHVDLLNGSQNETESG